MARLYHLAGPMLGIGSIILPGNWGRLIDRIGLPHVAWDREAALESWRHAFYLHKPSRKRSVFSFLTSTEAASFREREPGFGLHRLYEVSPVDPDVPTHVALVRDFRSLGPDDTGWPDRYWREGEAAAAETSVGGDPAVSMVAEPREVLIGGAVRIHACLDGG